MSRALSRWKLECLRTMGLQTESCPDPADGRVRKARRRRHQTDRPVRCIVWRRAERAFDNGGNLVVLDRSRSAGTGLIQEPSIRSFRNRRRHLPTVCSLPPRLSSSYTSSYEILPLFARRISRPFFVFPTASLSSQELSLRPLDRARQTF